MKRIEMIPPKLNPTHTEFYHRNLSLTRTGKECNRIARMMNDAIIFDPSITCRNNLAECFRIFTNLEKISNAR